MLYDGCLIWYKQQHTFVLWTHCATVFSISATVTSGLATTLTLKYDKELPED